MTIEQLNYLLRKELYAIKKHKDNIDRIKKEYDSNYGLKEGDKIRILHEAGDEMIGFLKKVEVCEDGDPYLTIQKQNEKGDRGRGTWNLNAMINYAAKARKAYLINNFDKILNSLNTLHSTVETMTLFVNDQAYNYILKLKEVIKGGPIYKHNIKRLLNDMDKEIKRYNASIYYINKERSEVIADITQAMEDCLMPYIDNLAGAIRAAVWSNGVSEERTEAAVLSLIVSSLAMTSGRLISGGYQIMKEMGGGWGGNPFTFMSIDKIRHLSTSLSDAITGGEIALEEKEANDITKAMDVFIEKISDSDIADKVISILEEAESKNKEERS